MAFLRRIRDYIEREMFLNELYDDARNLDHVLLAKRLELLNDIATPLFRDIGLNHWNGKYQWYSDFNSEGIKHVIEFNLLKGFSGGFTYGNCYNFVPTFSGKRLIHHRTEKSTKLIYYKRSDRWQKAIDTNRPINPDRINTANAKKFQKTLKYVLKKNITHFNAWFKQNSTIDDNILSLKKELLHPSQEAGIRIISDEYILAFLYKQKEDLTNAEHWMQEHFKKGVHNNLEMELLMKRLKN